MLSNYEIYFPTVGKHNVMQEKGALALLTCP